MSSGLYPPCLENLSPICTTQAFTKLSRCRWLAYKAIPNSWPCSVNRPIQRVKPISSILGKCMPIAHKHATCPYTTFIHTMNAPSCRIACLVEILMWRTWDKMQAAVKKLRSVQLSQEKKRHLLSGKSTLYSQTSCQHHNCTQCITSNWDCV